MQTLKITVEIPVTDLNGDKKVDLADIAREIRIVKSIFPTATTELVEE